MSDQEADAGAELISADAVTFASLPPLVVRLIFLALPADARERASCVCRAWRDVLADPSLWTRLDMTVVNVEEESFPRVVVGAAARACGQLRLLDLSQPPVNTEDVQYFKPDVLLQVLRDNAGSLRELHLPRVHAPDYLEDITPTVEEVMAAAPLLQVLTVEDVYCTLEDAPPILRAQPPFALLQMRSTLFVHVFDDDGMELYGMFAAALADAALQPALSRLDISFADTAQPAFFGALVDAALARRLRELKLWGCTPPPAAPLARLLAGSSLAVLDINASGHEPLFDAAGVELVADALRVNTTLKVLKLRASRLCRDMRLTGALRGALVGHPSLRVLGITGEEPADDAIAFAPLPPLLARLIFLALPVDARGRACCVCRAWRDALADPSLWTRLDLSGSCGVAREEFDWRPLLRGAAARARGLLYRLDLSKDYCPTEILLPLLAANAGSLRELRELRVRSFPTTDDPLTAVAPTVDALVAVAPLLQVVEADEMGCTWEQAPRVMRSQPPYTLLRLHSTSISVNFGEYGGQHGGMERFGPFAAALSDVTLQPTLSDVLLIHLDIAQPAVMGALVDAALARRLRDLWLQNCSPPPAALLARLLTEGWLTDLCLETEVVQAPLFDAAGAALVAGALRGNTTLNSLCLYGTGLCRDMDCACVLLSALVGHPSLCVLSLSDEDPLDDVGALAAALAALIAADVSVLHTLVCRNNSLGDAGLAPIVEALALNHHLRELDLGYNGMSEAFARERLLPAVRANTTLRSLACTNCSTASAAKEAEELVRRRWQHS